jgi:subtilisin family serine protease
LLAAAPVAAQEVPGGSEPAVAPSVARPSAPVAISLLGRAQERGRIRVIVGLREQPQPLAAGEGDRLALQAATARRARLAASQRAFLADLVGARPGGAAPLVGAGVQAPTLFETVPYLALTADPGALRRLFADPRVASVQEDVAMPPALAQSVPLVKADRAWASGFTGTGQAVAVLDTGVAKAHPAFKGKVVAEACYSTTVPGVSTSLCPGGASASTARGSGVNCPTGIPGCDHGTHVASIAVGDAPGLKGVARGAKLVAVKVFSRFDSPADCNGLAPCVRAFTSDIIRGLERVRALRATFKIASANLSLGSGLFASACDASEAATKAAVDRLRAVGVATAISSGNDGLDGLVGAPGCVSTAVTVGSSTKADRVSPFSNHAPLVDLLAPGSAILAAVPGGSGTKSGTSMAAPHVAGTWAVLKQAKPGASVAEVQAALACTGARLGRGGLAKPRIDVARALAVLRSPATGCR